MKILHIVSGNLTGGAARGAYWLHQALRELHQESTLWTNSPITLGDPYVFSTQHQKKSRIASFIYKQCDAAAALVYKKREKVIFSTGFFGVDFTKTQCYKEADIIHLHWINGGFVSLSDLAKIQKPIVWTLRDMWPFTGGCHYTMECDHYTKGCGKCKQLQSTYQYDLSSAVYRYKKKYLPQNMKIVGISSWLSNEAKKSDLFTSYDVRTIANNVNTKEFFPIDKKLAREILNIKTEKKIIVVGAQSLEDFYKGFSSFVAALALLDKEKYFICFFGNIQESVAQSLGFEYRSFGFLYDFISLRLLYSAGDIFVAPSFMDAFGKTLAESMACATPVVCFDATGPKDIVDHKINGYCAHPYEAEDLARGIAWIAQRSSQEYAQLAQAAVLKVKQSFQSSVVAQHYIELYKEILDEK